MKNLLVLPLVIPLLTAAVSIFFNRYPFRQRLLSCLGMFVLLITGLFLLHDVRENGILVIQMGDWPAPFGITLVADLLSSIMVSITGLMGFAIAVYSVLDIDQGRERYYYHPFFNILIMGVCGAFLTGDIFNLYVWVELMLISSFALMTLGGERAQLEGGVKYVVLNLFSSTFLLIGVGVIYGLTGSLNMADLALKLQTISPQVVTTVAMFFFIAFGIKSGVFPLFFWLPASYHRPPVAVSAIFAALLTKVGVYALIRLFTLLFTQDIPLTHTLILIIAGFTMLTGVLGALAQFDFRRLLSFHIISQIGYIIMGLGLFHPMGIAGSIFFLIHNIIAKTNLFLISGITYRLQGTFDLKKMGGLYKKVPWLGVLFLIPALSLAGLPPLSGFFAKLILIRASLEHSEYLIAGIALFVSLLTLLSMNKIWNEAFWKQDPQEENLFERNSWPELKSKWILLTPIILLASLTVFIGIYAEPMFRLTMECAEQLMDPMTYVTAVLGGP